MAVDGAESRPPGCAGQSEEFVIRSGVRTGLKRELAFTLKAQAEFCSPLGRTRSGKTRRTTPGLDPSVMPDSARELEKSDADTCVDLGLGKSVPNPTRKEDAPVSPTPSVEGAAAEQPAVVGGLDESGGDRSPRAGIGPVTTGDGSSVGAVAVTGCENEQGPKQSTAIEASSPLTEISSTVTGSGGSDGSEEAKSNEVDMGDGVSGPLRDAPKKSMETKMPKKVSLTKPPSNIRQLLATGLLEGMPVKYIASRTKWQASLHGVIKDTCILCYCSSCKGNNAVSAYQFELHARSTNKHPSDFIFLENGKSIRDVLNACSMAPMEVLESTILSATGSESSKPISTCEQCHGSFQPSRVGKLSTICDACLVERLSPIHPKLSATAPDSISKPTSLCQKCNGSFQASRIGTLSAICDACLVERLSPIHQNLSASSSESLKPYSTCQQCNGFLQTSDTVKQSTICDACLARRLSTIPQKPTPGYLKSTKSLKPDLTHASSSASSQKKNGKGRMTTKDLRLHKLVFKDDILPEGTEVAYYSRGQRLLEGYIKESGIYCTCCHSVVSASQFEAHAGWATRRKPYLNIYTSNGVSLHELAVSLSKGKKHSAGESDDLCRICSDGGDLLLCDLCPRAFHKECVGLSSIPQGDWYCSWCESMQERENYVAHNDNAIAAGRVSGVDPIEQIFQRSIRIIQSPDADASSCVLCKCPDFSKSGFNSRTVLLCDQCEREYHIGCLKEHNMADLNELPKGKWFCCGECSRIHNDLQNLLLCGSQKLPDQVLESVKRKHLEKGLSNAETNLEISWRVLHGKMACSESRLLLSNVISILHECFGPINDSITGQDLIPTMVYGKEMRDQDYGGMFCAVLMVNSSVKSAGLFRVLGCDVAELPLVATSKDCQGQGYFQSLFSCIESVLNSLNVKNLVLPAAEEAEAIWTEKFGFKKITIEQLEDYAKGARTMMFQGTPVLHKLVPSFSVSAG